MSLVTLWNTVMYTRIVLCTDSYGEFTKRFYQQCGGSQAIHVEVTKDSNSFTSFQTTQNAIGGSLYVGQISSGGRRVVVRIEESTSRFRRGNASAHQRLGHQWMSTYGLTHCVRNNNRLGINPVSHIAVNRLSKPSKEVPEFKSSQRS